MTPRGFFYPLNSIVISILKARRSSHTPGIYHPISFYRNYYIPFRVDVGNPIHSPYQMHHCYSYKIGGTQRWIGTSKAVRTASAAKPPLLIGFLRPNRDIVQIGELGIRRAGLGWVWGSRPCRFQGVHVSCWWNWSSIPKVQWEVLEGVLRLVSLNCLAFYLLYHYCSPGSGLHTASSGDPEGEGAEPLPWATPCREWRAALGCILAGCKPILRSQGCH